MNEGWEYVNKSNTTTNQALELQNLLQVNLDQILPTKSVKLSNKDKAWMDRELKILDRTKKREWCARGKSDKYVKLKQEFDQKFKAAAAKFLEKNVLELKDSDPGKAYATLKRMGAQPGDNLDDGTFAILQHLEENLTDQQSVERIAEYFSEICQEYPALDALNLSETVQIKLKNRLEAKLPYVSRYKVENMIRKSKKTKSGVPGDLPVVLTKEFGPELAAPLSTIYNNIVKTGKWPENWKIEHGLPLKKTTIPENEEQIRIISLTPFFSKVFERFVMQWLLEYLQEHLDMGQYGGQKGNSVNHYLVDFINFVQPRHQGHTCCPGSGC